MSNEKFVEVKTKYNDKDIVLKVVPITQETRLESQKHYAAAFNEALNKHNMSLRVQVDNMLKERNLLENADEDEIVKLREKLRNLERTLRKGVIQGRRMDKDEGKRVAIEMRKIRNEISNVGQSLSSYYSNTVESYASQEQMQYFIYACTLNYKNERFWPNFDEFKSDVNNEVYAEVGKAFVSLLTGLDKDYEKNHYENKWLIKMGFMNDKLQFVRSDGKVIDEDGRLIDKDSRFINDDGEFIDQFGNRVDRDGNLLEEDTWGVSGDTVVKDESDALSSC